MKIREKKELQTLKETFNCLLYNDSYFSLIRLVDNGTMTYSRALKVASDLERNTARRSEYYNLHKYASLLQI